jgi:CRP-like cAMP-binding protein
MQRICARGESLSSRTRCVSTEGPQWRMGQDGGLSRTFGSLPPSLVKSKQTAVSPRLTGTLGTVQPTSSRPRADARGSPTYRALQAARASALGTYTPKFDTTAWLLPSIKSGPPPPLPSGRPTMASSPPRFLADVSVPVQLSFGDKAGGSRASTQDWAASESSGAPAQLLDVALLRGGADMGYLKERLQLECGLSEEQIIGQMRRVRWFRSLPHSKLTRLYQRGRRRLFPRYTTIVREGSESNNFYILLHGQVRMHSTVHGTSALLTVGSSFGEDALIVSRVMREESAVAETDSYVLILSAADMHGMESALELYAEVRPQVVAQLLERVPALSSLTQAVRGTLAPLMEVVEYTSGATVFAEGDEPSPFTAMFIVCEGRVSLHKRDAASGGEANIGWRTPQDEGPWFGEGALANHADGGRPRPRPCTAVCTEHTKCVVVRVAHFDRFLEATWEVMPNVIGNFLSLASHHVGNATAG